MRIFSPILFPYLVQTPYCIVRFLELRCSFRRNLRSFIWRLFCYWFFLIFWLVLVCNGCTRSWSWSGRKRHQTSQGVVSLSCVEWSATINFQIIAVASKIKKIRRRTEDMDRKTESSLPWLPFYLNSSLISRSRSLARRIITSNERWRSNPVKITHERCKLLTSE